MYKIVLMNGGEAEYEAILKTFYATEDNNEKRFAFALGAAPSVSLRLRLPLSFLFASFTHECPNFFESMSFRNIDVCNFFTAGAEVAHTGLGCEER